MLLVKIHLSFKRDSNSPLRQTQTHLQSFRNCFQTEVTTPTPLIHFFAVFTNDYCCSAVHIVHFSHGSCTPTISNSSYKKSIHSLRKFKERLNYLPDFLSRVLLNMNTNVYLCILTILQEDLMWNRISEQFPHNFLAKYR